MMKRYLVMLFAFVALFSASAVRAEPASLAGRLCRAYEYEEDGVEAMIQFLMIDGEIFVEQSGLAYWAAVISPDDPAALSLEVAPEVSIAATARRWSGFSKGGEFWDDGVRAEIAISADGTLTLRLGDDEPITARPCATGVEIHDQAPAMYAEQLSSSQGEGGQMVGRWASDDGSVTATFSEGGRATVIARRAGEPPKVFFCVYGRDQSKVDMIGVRLGWGGQPFEISGELLPDGSLSLRGSLPDADDDAPVSLQPLGSER